MVARLRASVDRGGFPHRRALDEPGGEDEERRIFYVAVTRAMNELTLTYPLTIARGGRGPTTFTMPSRFLTEIDASLVEPGEIEIETAFDKSWLSFASRGGLQHELGPDPVE